MLGKLRIWLLVVGLVTHAYAQDLTIKGKITDNSGDGLPGVNVTVKGTQKGIVSDAEGKYQLSGVPTKATLVFSFIGYLKQEIEVNNRTVIDVVLEADVKSINEVVVVGYGTQRKIETTGSIASVKSSDLVQTPVANVAQGLQARVSGIQINQNSGSPGGNVSVRIRGTNSINGTSEPLYVVDGIQISNGGGINDVSPLSTINPNDIESVEVLKDASASAIYGARAANGVVLITTKRGKSGGTRVTLDSYFGVQKVTKTLPVLNAAEFAQLENEVFKNSYYKDPASLGEGVNWQNLIFREAPIQNHQLSINGGNEKTQVALSANYFDQDGIIISSNFKRYSYRLNLDHKISNRVKVGTSILGSYSVNSGIQTGSTSQGDADVVTGTILGAAIGAPPTLKPYRSDGSIFPFGEQEDGRYREVTNPLGLAAVLNKTALKRTLVNLYGEATILKGLTYRASFNVDLQNNINDRYSPRSIVSLRDLNDNSGSGSKSNSNFLGLLHESILTYSQTIATNHSLKFTGVFASQAEFSNANSISASGFPNDATQNEALQLALNRTVSSSRSKQRLDSYMGRVNYGYKDKYFLDLTARVDGSSRFGANNKYGFFPAVSAAWRLIEEPFLKSATWLSDLKLRASYGITGNAGGISPYQSLSTVAATGSDYVFNNAYVTGINPTGIANPDLRWEKSTQANVGLDVSILNNRFSLIVDVYDKITRDLLYIKTLPLSSGYASITGNYASLENKGVEFAANARILDGPLKWNVSANLTRNRNKVLDLDGGTTTERFITSYTILKVGEPLGLIKSYIFDGINQTGETILPGYDGRLGGHKVKDLNGDGTITSADQTITGNPNPNFIFGFSTNLSFKGFDLSAFLSGSQGNDIYNLSRLSFENPLGQRNLLKGVVNRWSPTNPSNQYVSAAQGGRLPVSSYYVEDGSYIRCKNLTLGYTLPAIKGVQNIRVYVSGNNLFTLTNYSGFDPEVNTFAGSNTVIGIDNFVYPQARSFLGGIQVTF
ncbi:TonB-linked SusC/RagA family outer membrane protein [Runella defluvii]|uniref:TonB-linked SusC/RagA family outer membrane protein n=1 Tax=Runella defluvii TaxID=370973 RepID=A0A7W5ZQG8_9BACT|nr:TonB-dependent receptor [Runella defluvii]MBB3840880.1 TonB-linked SusC/RagA family outer membrane protein [Runella defluvii]